MLEQLQTLVMTNLTSNQMLSAGIGTVVTGGLLVAIKEIPYNVYFKIKKFFSIELTLTTRHECYNDVIKLVNGKRFPFLTRNFSLTFFASSSKGLIPGYGSSYGVYNGKFFHIQKEKLENKNEIEDQITISFLTRDKSIVNQLIDEASEKEDYSKTIRVYCGYSKYMGLTYKDMPKRPLDTVFIDDSVKDSLMNRIRKFQANEKWYLDRGIPYKLSILLYGIPGTGKTSLVKAVASELNKNISYIDSFDNIDSMMEDVNKDNVIVIEDIDAINNLSNREDDDEPKNEKDTLQKVLNVLDGMSTPHGAIFIMTTNYPDKLDPALRRKGRIDEMVEIPLVAKETMQKMFKAFYGIDISKDVKYTPKTGAVLQDLFITYSAIDVIPYLV